MVIRVKPLIRVIFQQCSVQVQIVKSESESSPPSPRPSHHLQVRVRVITSRVRVRVKKTNSSLSHKSSSPHIFNISLSSKHENKLNIFPTLIYFNKLPILQMNPLNRFIILLVFIGHKFQNTCMPLLLGLGRDSYVTISESESK